MVTVSTDLSEMLLRLQEKSGRQLCVELLMVRLSLPFLDKVRPSQLGVQNSLLFTMTVKAFLRPGSVSECGEMSEIHLT